MDTPFEISAELDRMIVDGIPVKEIASLINMVFLQGKNQMTLLANLNHKLSDFLTVENIRSWPEEYAPALGMLFCQMQCYPDRATFPCGKKELVLATVLEDRSIPKAIRAPLWRAFNMDGYVFPCYARSAVTWNVPLSLYDHYAVRDWYCKTKQEGWQDIQCSDSAFYAENLQAQFKTKSEQQSLQAILKDSPAELLMPLDIEGKSLSFKYCLATLEAKAINISTYLYCNNKEFLNYFPPRRLLLYVCANWNSDATIPFVSMLEKDSPGLVRKTIDVFGHDALWYTLYQKDKRRQATLAARRKMDPLDRLLIDYGCDPNRENAFGFSYHDITV